MKKCVNKKGLIIILLILFVMVGACYLYLPQAYAADEKNQELVLEEGQEYTFAEITSLSGNEMEYIILDAQVIDSNDLQKKDSGRKERGANENVRGERRGVAQEQQMQTTNEIAYNVESMPTISENPKISSMPMTGERPDIGEMPDMGSMSDVNRIPNMGNIQTTDVQKTSTKDKANRVQEGTIINYAKTDETGQMQIPVGTEVETKLGTITTFSRLSNGDIIKMLLQKDDTGNKVLMKIWIVE